VDRLIFIENFGSITLVMKFNVLTIFPNIISSYCNETILGRGQKAGAIKINPVNIRDFTEDKHNTVDDSPYGGGAGMVMKPEPIYKALKSLKAIPFSKADGLSKLKTIFSPDIKKKKRTVLLSPRGKQFDQRMAEKWSRLDEITFVCGRYEGVDQRVVDNMVDEEISIGPYVLAGGELGAMVMIEAVSRLIPGVLGNAESLKEETHNEGVESEYAQYTKPEEFKGWKVPSVLLSGNHAEIKKWREEQSKK